MLPKLDPALIGASLGFGCYAYVYKYGEDQALKLAYDDGTRDYLEWCFIRGRRHGRGSPQMANLPWVYAIGAIEALPSLPAGVRMPLSGWYALMERYDCTIGVHMGWESLRCPEELRDMPELAPVVALMHAELGDDAACDLHSSNVMWSAVRGELIITDPNSGSYSGSYRDTARRLTIPGSPPKRFGDLIALSRPRKAQWKLPPLQEQFHMRVQ